MAGASGAVGLEGAGIRSRGKLGFGKRGVVGARGARCREEGAVRLLRRMREVTLEAVEEDRGATFSERKRVAPETQCQSEPEIRAEQWVRAFAWEVRSRPRHADADGVELAVERDAPELDAAQQRFAMGDGRWARERRGDGALQRNRAQDISAQRLRERSEELTE